MFYNFHRTASFIRMKHWLNNESSGQTVGSWTLDHKVDKQMQEIVEKRFLFFLIMIGIKFIVMQN